MTIAQMHFAACITHNNIMPWNWVVKEWGESYKKRTGSQFEFTLVDFGCATPNDVRAGYSSRHSCLTLESLSDVP